MTLAKFFDDVAAGIGLGPPVDRTAIAELRADLARALDEVGARIPHDAPTLVLTKSRVARRARMRDRRAGGERGRRRAGTRPRLGPARRSHRRARTSWWAVFRTDPFASAMESLKAERSTRTLAWLDAAPPEVIADLRDDLAHRRVRVRESWPPVDPNWWPDRRTRRASPSPKGDWSCRAGSICCSVAA